jgi:MarR family 2-MHQ and catechol resistance regulon transcriptional repressor
VDLAQQVLLTASGVTRLLDGLERAGLVARDSCDTDRRVVYAVLTDAGVVKIREASGSHFAQVDEMFSGRFDQTELQQLASLLSRLDTAEAESC